jgi:hypothetical protein
MIGHADAAIRTGENVSAAPAQKRAGKTAPVQQNDCLLSAIHATPELLLQTFRNDGALSLALKLGGHVDDRDLRQGF